MRHVQHGRDQELPPPMPRELAREYRIQVKPHLIDHLYRAGVLLDNIAEALPGDPNALGMAEAVNEIVGQISNQDLADRYAQGCSCRWQAWDPDCPVHGRSMKA